MKNTFNGLEGVLKNVKSYVHRDLYKLLKSKSSIIKRGATEADENLILRFADDVDIGVKKPELIIWNHRDGVQFVTAQDSVCPLNDMLACKCAYASGGDEAALKPMIEEMDRVAEVSRKEQEKVAAEMAATALADIEASVQRAKQEKLDSALAKKVKAAAVIQKKKQKALELKQSKQGTPAVDGAEQQEATTFQMNAKKRDQVSSKDKKKVAEDVVRTARQELKRKATEATEPEFHSGFDVRSNEPLESERVRAADSADRSFISNELIVDSPSIYIPPVTGMAGEDITAEEEELYAERNSHRAGGRSLSHETDSSSGDEDDSGEEFDAHQEGDGSASHNAEDEVTPVKVKKPRKPRDRSMREDIVQAYLNCWFDADAEDDDAEAGNLVLAAELETNAKLSRATDDFKDFLIRHVKAQAFSELHFERRVLQFITFITIEKKKTINQVYVVNWPKVLSEIGAHIIAEFRVSNRKILISMNAYVYTTAEEDQNATDMKAFTRVFVHKINCITLCVALKLVDEWMKFNKLFCDPDNLRLAKRARKADFMSLYHKVSAGEYVCESVRDAGKVMTEDEEAAESNAKPDVESLMSLVKELPKDDAYMRILIEVTTHQAKGRAVDWDVDTEMRALFNKKPIPVKVAVPAGLPVARGVVTAVPLDVAPRTPAGSGSASVVGLDLPSASSIETPVSNTSRGPPPIVEQEIISEPLGASLRKLLKQLLEFVLAGINEQDENLLLELKNIYRSDNGNDESLVLLMGLLKFVVGKLSGDGESDLSASSCCEILRAQVFIPFLEGDGANTLGNGYCFYIAGLQLRERARWDYSLTVDDMVSYAAPLFTDDPDDGSDISDMLRSFMECVITSLEENDCYPERAAHVRKLEAVIKQYNNFPFDAVGPEFYGHLEWVNVLPFNMSVFDSKHDQVGLKNWAKLAAASVLSQQHSDIGSCRTLKELMTFFGIPLNPCVFTRPHFHVIASPSQDVMMKSFVNLVEAVDYRIIERVRCFDYKSVLSICEKLVGKSDIAAGASNIIGASIELVFSAMREDVRVPSAVLFAAMKPVATTIAVARNVDAVKKYIAKIAEMVCHENLYVFLMINYYFFAGHRNEKNEGRSRRIENHKQKIEKFCQKEQQKTGGTNQYPFYTCLTYCLSIFKWGFRLAHDRW
jgi:hypothetical protein